MALEITRRGILSGIGGYRGAAHSMVHGASSMLRSEIKLVSHAEIGLSSFVFGVIQGRYQKQGGAVFFGLPVDLLSGAAFHLFSLLGVARPYKHHLQSIGTGAIATYLATTGYRVGERWATGTKFLPALTESFKGKSSSLGNEELPVSGGSSMADVELKKLVQGEAAEG
jgi:hypothetical protein